MDGIFQSIGLDRPHLNEPATDEDLMDYDNLVRSMIEDAVDYNDSDLSPIREDAIKYYEGIYPPLDDTVEADQITGDPMAPDDDDVSNRSHAVSTDVRDTVLAIMPSLIRIFTSAENVVNFVPRNAATQELAKQQTDGVNYTFWEENEGFLLLHDVFKDALIQNIGVVKWWTEHENCVREESFSNITILQLSGLIEEYQAATGTQVEVLEAQGSAQEGILARVKLRYIESSPRYRIEAVPPEEFRINRRAKSIAKSSLVGHQTLQTPSDIIKLGYDRDTVEQYKGKFSHYTVEEDLRTPGINTSWMQQEMVEWGEYFIMIDSDGDGIDELHHICVIGDNYEIMSDEIVDDRNMALFCGDPRPHTAIGDSIASLTKDIQKINTQILRGSLDSLSASMFSDYVVNEMVTSVEDVMADGVGKIIRTRADPTSAVHEFKKSFIGDAAFTMMGTMDAIRQRRTGISEASKGVDPKALQSTTVAGVDAIVTGAQERIELIARIFAETGFKDMFRGLAKEMARNPNKAKTVEMRGKWIEVDPSLFDPNLTVRVNPTMGKGTDMNRLMALNEIKGFQLMVFEKFGAANSVVTPDHIMNTMDDMLAIANVKDTSRYYTRMTPEQLQALQTAPKDPSPEELIAQAEIEKVKSQTANNIAKTAIMQEKNDRDEDFRRDKLQLDTLAKLAVALAKVDIGTVDSAIPTITQENQIG